MRIISYDELNAKMPNVWRVTMFASKFKFSVIQEEGLRDTANSPKNRDAWNDCLLFDNKNEADDMALSLNVLFETLVYHDRM